MKNPWDECRNARCPEEPLRPTGTGTGKAMKGFVIQAAVQPSVSDEYVCAMQLHKGGGNWFSRLRMDTVQPQ
jgi:hypothetical protein